MALPQTADVVVIGGGVIGTSIAFHLARMKAGQVVLLERKHLAAGSTGTSSGLVRMHYDNALEAEIALKSFEVFRHFDDLVGGECGFVQTGFLRTVKPHNLERLKANVAMLQGLGVNTRLVTGDEIGEMAPYLQTDDIPFAAYEPESGYADAHLTTMGFANAARRHGARIFQGAEVTGIERNGHHVRGVRTTEGRIAAPVVVNAAGPWGGLVAAMAGVPLETQIMHHQVAVVEAPPEVPWPHLTVIDRLHQTYLRPETGRLTLIGASHDNYPLNPDQLDRYSETLTYETMYRVLEHLCGRIPAMETGAVRKGHAGIYLNSADKHMLFGPAPRLEGFYCTVGCSGHGFKEAPVIGQAMAELVTNGRADVVDMTPLRLTRFEEGEPYQAPHAYV
ncbi:MAG: NAD(P)/FAD-dependent oxidoreductase [Anaerolineae bacterium]|jgi:sarcosine oxidase subunit beta